MLHHVRCAECGNSQPAGKPPRANSSDRRSHSLLIVYRMESHLMLRKFAASFSRRMNLAAGHERDQCMKCLNVIFALRSHLRSMKAERIEGFQPCDERAQASEIGRVVSDLLNCSVARAMRQFAVHNACTFYGLAYRIFYI